MFRANGKAHLGSRTDLIDAVRLGGDGETEK